MLIPSSQPIGRHLGSHLRLALRITPKKIVGICNGIGQPGVTGMITAPDLSKLSQHSLRFYGATKVASHVAIRHISGVAALCHCDESKLKTLGIACAQRRRTARLGHVKLGNRE